MRRTVRERPASREPEGGALAGRRMIAQNAPVDADVVVIGAGLAGLSAGRALARTGLRPIVLERKSAVGGRCATRTIDGQPVDHGTPFLHGRNPAFIAALESVDATLVRGWPFAGSGPGTPCQPDALEPSQTRIVYREGLVRFPLWAAQGLDVRRGAAATALREIDRGIAVSVAGGEVCAPAAVIATPPPEVLALLGTLAPAPDGLAEVAPMLDLVHTEPCLIVIARYAAGTPAPVWDAHLPPWGPLQAIVHDSSKRSTGAVLTLVLHGRGGFSRTHATAPPGTWSRALLEAAASDIGAWVGSPERVDTHVWPVARVLRPTELAAPVTLALPRGGRLALAGEAFGPEGGLEGAWRSGERVAEWLAAAPAGRAA